jgi:hypothetical protein
MSWIVATIAEARRTPSIVYRRRFAKQQGDRASVSWPVRSIENQAELMRHRARELLAGQRTAALNALRGHLAEIRRHRTAGRAACL